MFSTSCLLHLTLIFHGTYAIRDQLLSNNNSHNDVYLNRLEVDDGIKIIYEYLEWRNLGQVVLFQTTKGGTMFNILEYLHKNNVYVTLSRNPDRTSASFQTRQAVILIVDGPDHGRILTQASRNKLFKERLSWILIHPASVDFIQTLRVLNLKFDSDVVSIAYPDSFFDSTKCEASEVGLPIDSYFLRQIYKIKADDDSSLVIKNLGKWDSKSGFMNLSSFIPVELRIDFHGFPIRIGLRNESDSKYYKVNGITNEDAQDDQNIENFIEVIVKSLNATAELVMFDNLGEQISGGKWTDLLGAVVNGEVDIAIEAVPVTFTHLEHMAFSYEILTISRNLYLTPAKQSIIRDTYQRPFSRKLTVAVFLVIVLMMTSMFLVFRFGAEIQVHVQLTDSVVWAVGILTMQGTIYENSSGSARIITFFSLIFALMVFNSYSAFITAVLSVRTSDIDTLQDVFHYRYDIGYMSNSEDAHYLQEQTNELGRLYIAGCENQIDDIDSGLLEAATRKLAFFAAGAKGRKKLNMLTPRDYRCKIQELILPQTEQQLAFPINVNSPYKKIINLSIFRLKESGALANMKHLMYPSLPMCDPTSTYISAEIEDINIPLYILGAGYVLSVTIMAIEILLNYYKSRDVQQQTISTLDKKLRMLHSNKNAKKVLYPNRSKKHVNIHR